MDALENEIDSAKYEVIRQYADMVVSTFKTLAQKYVPVSYEDFWPENFDSLDNSSQDDSAQDEADSAQGQLKAKKDALDQLESNLMLLKHLITTMCLSLDPLRLVEDPALHLQLVLDIQPQFEHTYDQIKRATDIIFLRQANYSRRSDQHLQILKSFRLRHLQYSLRECLEESTFDFLHVWGDSIVAVGFSHVHFLSRHSARPRPWTPCPTVLEWIDYTVIKCLKQSEFNLVQQHWSYQISLINHHLEYFVRSIHLITPTRQNQPVIQIAKSLPTIIKLCRLLVGKISKCCTKRLPFFTGMRSDQLKCLEDFPDKPNHSKRVVILHCLLYRFKSFL
ncbi:hypothetical protein PCANC_17417 [Puccinia coronata f. sp. avenae]|uniref:Uncharacterized protein n=1 Tax=Puccinia coronata f. sp. avenae TaxID=200324 RepID=A0A2N5UUZ9_9BASI|nr:hypothetical protein PCANC_17417 [Puccinia coronata f. sp. avenae]